MARKHSNVQRRPSARRAGERVAANKPGRAAVNEEMSDSERRSSLLEEHFLRREVTRLEAWRRDSPAMWREEEKRRVSRNREQAALNKRLRDAGCQPVALDPSLEQKLQKLQQLEARNAAEVARFKAAT